MAFGTPDDDPAFQRALADRLTELRLQVDLGDIPTPAAFRAALERDGRFLIRDPRVREACTRAGLARWLFEPFDP